jgi:hypothetical protein
LRPWPTDIGHFNEPIDSLKYCIAQEFSVLLILAALRAKERDQTNPL